MELHERLRELRKKAGYSQEALAEALDVSRQAVSKWESGTTNPDINNLIRLGELYQVSTDFILLGSSPEEELSDPEPPKRTPKSAEQFPIIIKEEPSTDKKQSANGFLWLGLGVLAVLILYFATNGF